VLIPNARFEEFLRRIEPPKGTREDNKVAYSALCGFLGRPDIFQSRLRSCHLSGSYARNTAIRPERSGEEVERSDLDVIVVTRFDHETIRPRALLTEMARVLEGRYEVERINTSSVRVRLEKADIDVVPLIPFAGRYLIPYAPEEGRAKYRETNSPEHVGWCNKLNRRFRGRFKPLVKILKWWRRHTVQEQSLRPRGFALEVLAARWALKREKHYGRAFLLLLERLYDQRKDKPFLRDPVLAENDVIHRVTDSQWDRFQSHVGRGIELCFRANRTKDLDEARDLWRKILGDPFHRA
jgi:predicted nucleotidyltransferase